VIGNLPYSSASLMIAALVQASLGVKVMVFTVQKELAERITAEPTGKSYSSFTVLCRAAVTAVNRGDLKPGSFYPAPNVASTILELRPRGDSRVGDWDAFSGLTRALFASRRKTIRNNLSVEGALPGVPVVARLRAVEEAGLDAGARAQELEPEDFVRLSRLIFAKRPPTPAAG
jgi:16S rRNA (adenine1518-N6/adenine1519-N6)-dimethyltransferase